MSNVEVTGLTPRYGSRFALATMFGGVRRYTCKTLRYSPVADWHHRHPPVVHAGRGGNG